MPRTGSGREARADGVAERGRSEDEVLYLYGFVPLGTEEPSGDLEGLGGRPVEVLRLEGFGAVVGRLPESEYGEEAVDARLDDLEWVGEQALAHERVVTWFVDREWIVPVRMLTLFSSRRALEEDARERSDAVREALSEMEESFEWDVRISRDLEEVKEGLGEASDEVATLRGEIESASEGRRYLLRKKLDDVLQEEGERVADELAARALDQLDELAAESVRLAPPDGAEGAGAVVNAAFLVPAGEEERFRSEVARLSEEMEGRGVEVEATGPWAPYRFVPGRDERA